MGRRGGVMGASWEPHGASWERLGGLLGAPLEKYRKKGPLPKSFGLLLGAKLEAKIQENRRQKKSVIRYVVFFDFCKIFIDFGSPKPTKFDPISISNPRMTTL